MSGPVEMELDAMIVRRSRKGEVDPDEREELWKESVRRYDARRERELRSDWYEFHIRQARRLEASVAALVAHHVEQAERYL